MNFFLNSGDIRFLHSPGDKADRVKCSLDGFQVTTFAWLQIFPDVRRFIYIGCSTLPDKLIEGFFKSKMVTEEILKQRREEVESVKELMKSVGRGYGLIPREYVFCDLFHNLSNDEIIDEHGNLDVEHCIVKRFKYQEAQLKYAMYHCITGRNGRHEMQPIYGQRPTITELWPRKYADFFTENWHAPDD